MVGGENTGLLRNTKRSLAVISYAKSELHRHPDRLWLLEIVVSNRVAINQLGSKEPAAILRDYGLRNYETVFELS